MIYDILFLIVLIILALLLKKIFNKYIWILPAPFIAGILGLLSSEQILNVYNHTINTKVSLEVFLSIIFATFPLTINGLALSFIKKVNPLWTYSLLQYFLQWGLSLLVTIFIFTNIWPSMTDFFAVTMPGGFAGGYGSAAVLSSLITKLSEIEILSLTMTMATIGTFTSLVGGMLWIIWAKHTNRVTINPVVAKESIKYKIDSKGIITLVAILLIVSISFFIKPLITSSLKINFPLFIITVCFSFLLKVILKKYKFSSITLTNIANKATGLLVILGILSIKISVVYEFMIPIIIMSLIGILLCIFNFLFLAPKFFKTQSFEKGLFTWGWSSGGLVFGLALVNIVTKGEENIKLTQQFAMAYLLVAPFEMGLLLSMPYLIYYGYAHFVAIFLILLAFILVKTGLKSTDK